MTIFECDKCGYSTPFKSYMNKHLVKKLPCKKQVVKVNWEVMNLVKIAGLEILKMESDMTMLDKELFKI